jgi:hypothetical protein
MRTARQEITKRASVTLSDNNMRWKTRLMHTKECHRAIPWTPRTMPARARATAKKEGWHVP